MISHDVLHGKIEGVFQCWVAGQEDLIDLESEYLQKLDSKAGDS